MKSPITENFGDPLIIRDGFQYFKDELNNWFCGELPQGKMVGGQNETMRNLEPINKFRLDLIFRFIGAGKVLDYGCGNGYLTSFLLRNGIPACGYDKFNDKYVYLPDEFFDVITLIEVIEHLWKPFSDLQIIYDHLAVNGKLYIETTFTDEIAPEHEYLNPSIGHGLIFSHEGLEVLLKRFGFKLFQQVNKNVKIFRKI